MQEKPSKSALIRFSHEAEKHFVQLDQSMRRRVIERTELLSADPYNPHLGKILKGTSELRSSRIGSWRMLYRIEQKEPSGEIQILAIRPRGRAYRNL